MNITSNIKEKIIDWRKNHKKLSVTETRGTFLSSDGKTNINYIYLSPEEEPKVVFQFIHGMGEHLERYIEFGEFLGNHGVAFFMCDNLGHGNSSVDDEHLGYFGDWKYLVCDAKKLTDIAKETYPNTTFVLGGHSMGSFICRAYLNMYPNETKNAVLVGTGNSNVKIKSGKLLARLIGRFKGETYRSQLLQILSFGSYNKRIENPKTIFDWLNRNEDNVRNYMGDHFCGFTFTTNGFAEISDMMTFVTKKSTIKKYNKDISVLILGGDKDPVSNYGKDVTRLANKIKRAYIENVDIKLYQNMRHEVLQETGKEEVYKDVLAWLNNVKQ